MKCNEDSRDRLTSQLRSTENSIEPTKKALEKANAQLVQMKEDHLNAITAVRAEADKLRFVHDYLNEDSCPRLERKVDAARVTLLRVVRVCFKPHVWPVRIIVAFAGKAYRGYIIHSFRANKKSL